jgi:CTP synthase (UTP-ammonia lyase)
MRIALIGDRSDTVVAHRAIPLALQLAAKELGCDVTWASIKTPDVDATSPIFSASSAVWLVPASPYANMDGALAAVRFARESERPFLGTCGGFQHALIEFARNVLGLADADHAETNPHGSSLVIAPLSCSLVEKSGLIRFSEGSRLRDIYGVESASEGYHCNYGPAVAYRERFHAAGLNFTAFDEAGEPRGAELPVAVHPFFIGTLFQPERAALLGKTPPVVRAFVQAAHAFAP